MIVIADSSALIALSICNCLPILEPLFGEIQVPTAVFKEVCIPGKPEAEILRTWLVLLCHIVIVPTLCVGTI